MAKKTTKKTLNPRTKKILGWMQGKIPVECPKCSIRLLRSPETLTERCGNCLEYVNYVKLK